MSDGVASRAEMIEREGRVVELVNEGYTMTEVAGMTGYANAGGVSKAYWRAMKRYPAKQVEDHRANENIKLDALEVNAEQIEADAINTADLELALKAQDRRLKIMDRRAKLNGLDAPVKTETEVTGGPFAFTIPPSRLTDQAREALSAEESEGE